MSKSDALGRLEAAIQMAHEAHKFPGEDVKQVNAAVRLLLAAFVIVCVFDPADQILGAKVWLFVALWGVTWLVALPSSGKICLSIGLLFTVLLFIAIPTLSILWYYLADGTEPYAGLGLLKSYFLVSLAIVLAVNRADVIPLLSGVLSVVALLTITVWVGLYWWPELLAPLQDIGTRSGVFLLSQRSYGEGLSFTQVDFVTAPMLAISIAHYFDRAMTQPSRRAKLINLALTAINITGMLLAGLRNTMAVALLLPNFLWPLYTRRIARNALLCLGALAALFVPFSEKLAGFLDPSEISNSVKLTFLRDYAQIFSNPVTLLFGQGLGAYYRWSSSGQPDFESTGANFYFITELTYAEMIRSFGLIGAAIMLMLLLLPVAQAFFVSTNRRHRTLAVAFLAYLGMSATNPMLFSSLGMLIFPALLAVTFQPANLSKNWPMWRES